MEEIEVMSWETLDALKKAAVIIESVGDLQSGHCQSIFCKIEDDLLELCYSDTASNFIRRFEDKEELDLALESRKEDVGDTVYDEDRDFDENFEDIESDDEDDYEDSEKF